MTAAETSYKLIYLLLVLVICNWSNKFYIAKHLKEDDWLLHIQKVSFDSYIAKRLNLDRLPFPLDLVSVIRSTEVEKHES